MKLKTLKDFNVEDLLVLLRVDINAPVVKGKILDEPRIKSAAETIKYLLSKGAKLVILAHQGRKGDRDFLSLEQHSKLLSKHSGKEIKYVDALFEDLALNEIDQLEQGEAILLKNVREYEDETTLEDSRFYAFSELFDLYVNDAFSVSHRKQGSIVIPPKQTKSCIGLQFEKEISVLEKFSTKGKKTIYLLGGQKIDDYVPMFYLLENKNSKILASGVLANLLLIAQGKDLGYESSWMKEKFLDSLMPKLKELLSKYKDQILLPIDFAVGDRNIEKAKRKEVSLSQAPFNEKIWDVGSKTTDFYSYEIEKSEVVFMKGPLGYSEIPAFSDSTVAILKKISQKTKENKVFSLLGGGHLTSTLENYNIPNNFSYISLSGGALIAYISGLELPGISALMKGHKK